MCRGVSILYFNTPLSVAPYFSRISQAPGHDQQNGKQTWCQLSVSHINTYFHISINSLGFYLSPECLLGFLSNLYILPWLRKCLKFMVSIFLEAVSNLGLFTHSPFPIKILPKVFIITSSSRRQRGVTHFPQTVFFRKSVSPNSRKGWRKP